MISIREGMFETNSSSCHTLCIKGKKNFDIIRIGNNYVHEIEKEYEDIETYNNVLIIDLANYNRDSYILSSPNQKIAYLTCYFLTVDCHDSFDLRTKSQIKEFNDVINHKLDKIPELYIKHFEKLTKFFDNLKQISKCDYIYVTNDSWFYEIDHQTCEAGSLINWLKYLNISLEELIKNRNILIAETWESFDEDELIDDAKEILNKQME